MSNCCAKLSRVRCGFKTVDFYVKIVGTGNRYPTKNIGIHICRNSLGVFVLGHGFIGNFIYPVRKANVYRSVGTVATKSYASPGGLGAGRATPFVRLRNNHSKCLFSMLRQPTFRLNGGLAAHARGGNGLTVIMVGYVARGKDAWNVGNSSVGDRQF